MGSIRNIRGQERRAELKAAAIFGEVYAETVREEENLVLLPMYRYGYSLFQLKGQGQRFRLADSSYSSNSCTLVRRSVVVSLLEKGLIETTDDKTYYNSRIDCVLSEKGRELMGQLYHFAAVQGNEINRRSRVSPMYIREYEPQMEA